LVSKIVYLDSQINIKHVYISVVPSLNSHNIDTYSVKYLQFTLNLIIKEIFGMGLNQCSTVNSGYTWIWLRTNVNIFFLNKY